jgi:asparagine synthetase B (glutamine-hydrolysing)
MSNSSETLELTGEAQASLKERAPIPLDFSRLNSFLHYGYLPQLDMREDLIDWLSLSREEILAYQRRWQKVTLDEVIQTGVSILRESFAREGSSDDGPHYVLLSGGLDSRVILAALLEQESISDDVEALTSGIPGTWDYEIGRQVAREAGVTSRRIDLRAVAWEMEKLVDMVSALPCPVPVLNAFLHARLFAEHGDRGVYWSGFMGDPLAGSHLSETQVNSKARARRQFAAGQRLTKEATLTHPSYRPEKVIERFSFVDPTLVDYSAQLDFGVRQWGFIRPQILQAGYCHRIPFLNADWTNFMVSLPRNYKHQQVAYEQILLHAFPELFTLPTKANLGLPLSVSPWRWYAERIRLAAGDAGRRWNAEEWVGPDPRQNYVSIGKELRKSPLKEIAATNLANLQKRNVIDRVDIEEIWRSHQREEGNYFKALDLLVSLEIYLKTGVFEE